jgi:hypothetical protein
MRAVSHSEIPSIYKHLHVRDIMIPVSDYTELPVEDVVLLGSALLNQWLWHLSRPECTDL